MSENNPENTSEFSKTSWREKVYIETSEHIICGDIFMPKIGKQTRLITDVLNSGRNFVAVKNCTVEYKHIPSRTLEEHDFIQVNIASIIIMRPYYE